MRQSEIDKERAAKRSERVRQAQLNDVAELLAQPAFRRYLKRYLGVCNVFATTFTGSSETFFKEGQRSIGTTIFGEVMQVSPERFSELMRERMPEDEEEPDDE